MPYLPFMAFYLDSYGGTQCVLQPNQLRLTEALFIATLATGHQVQTRFGTITLQNVERVI